jgi:hypothetical protein
MNPDAFFAACESRQIAESPYLRRRYGLDIAPPQSALERRLLNLQRLPASERRWKQPRVCACGFETTWPPAWGSHKRGGRCRSNS